MITIPTRLLIAFAIISFAGVPAQEAKPGDPFIKSKAATKAEPKPEAKADPATPLLPVPLPRNLILTFETYTLPQESLDALLKDAPPSKTFHEKVRGLMSEGKSSLEQVLALPTRSGQRATVESSDEVLYPTEFAPPVPGSPLSFPTGWEMRPTGPRVEVDPVANPEETICDLNLAAAFTRLAGFRENKADPQAPGQLWPLFTTRKITAAVSCPIGEPILLGTSNTPHATGLPEAEGDGKASVTFAMARFSSNQALPPVGEPPAKVVNIRMVLRVYSLPRDKARDLLASTTDGEEMHDRLCAMAAGEWKLERLMTLHTRSGQRATTEEVAENIFGAAAQPPTLPRVEGREELKSAKPIAEQKGPVESPFVPNYTSATGPLPASFTAVEMRPLGWRFEIDPVIGEKGSYVDLNLSVEHTEYRRNLEGHELLARYPQIPVFGSRKITTAVTTIPGRQCLLGTMSPPGDTGVNGRKDDGKSWLAFMRVTLE